MVPGKGRHENITFVLPISNVKGQPGRRKIFANGILK